MPAEKEVTNKEMINKQLPMHAREARAFLSEGKTGVPNSKDKGFYAWSGSLLKYAHVRLIEI